ncbi:MAG: MFS transporter [Promethearchaeota archaeon]
MEQETVEKIKTIYLISTSILLITSIFCGLAYNVFAFILPWVVDSEPTWGIDESMLGNLMGVMVLLFAGGGLIAAFYCDKISKKPVAAFGGIFTGISCILTGIAPTWDIFVTGVILIGIGNGIISPVIFALISDITPPEKRSTNYGVFILFGLLGAVFGVIIFIGFLLNGIWRAPYVITGIITIILSIMIIFVKIPPKGGKEHALEDLLKDGEIDYDYSIELSDIPVILKRKSNIILILNFADALPSGIFMFATLWLSTEHHLDMNLAFFFAIILLVARFMSPPVWGKVADNIYKKTGDELSKIKFCLTLLIVYTPIFIIAILIPWDASEVDSAGELLLMPDFLLFLILLSIGFFISSGTQPVWQSAISEINLPEHRATSYQLAMFIDQIGVAIGVILGGYLIVWFAPNGYTVAFIFAAIAGMINILTWVLALRYYVDDKHYVENILNERVEILKKKQTPV